jgi:hypothetical protein
MTEFAEFTFYLPAFPSSTFAQGAFESQVGKVISFNGAAQGELLGAEVDADGAGVRLTIRTTDPDLVDQISWTEPTSLGSSHKG